MTTRLLLLISVLISAIAAQDGRPAEKDLEWGDHSQGLRMVAWTDPETVYVSVVTRNFSPRRVFYSDSDAGDLKIFARRDAASKWRRIELKPTGPREVIPLFSCYAVEPKGEVGKFGLDLREYDFPADWNGSVEVRIHRVLSLTERVCEKSYRTVKVKSRTFNVKLPLSNPT